MDAIDIQPPLSPLEMSSSSVDEISNRNSDSVSCSDECLWSEIEPVKLNNDQIYNNSDSDSDDEFGDANNDLSDLVTNGHDSKKCDNNESTLYIEAKNDYVGEFNQKNKHNNDSSIHINGKDYFSDFLDKCNDTVRWFYQIFNRYFYFLVYYRQLSIIEIIP